MNWYFDTQKPIYAQLTEQIRVGILTGEYPPGSAMPSVRALALEAEVNPNTMQRALADLESRGLLHSQRTAGRFVTEDQAMIEKIKMEQAEKFIESFLTGMKGLGFDKDESISMLAGHEAKNAKGGSDDA